MIKNRKIFVAIVLIIIAILCFVFYFFTKNVPTKQNIVSNAMKSVVLIETYDVENNKISTGSGFVILDENKIITNFHVVEGSYVIKIKANNNKSFKVSKIIAFSKDLDIALLEVPNTDLVPLEMELKEKVEIGDDVIAIGSPLGLKNTVSDGIISGINSNYYDQIQTTAPISPGSSGGVLLNKEGEIIGITYAGIQEGQNLNFAINVSKLNLFLDTAIYNKENDDIILGTINNSNYEDCINSWGYDYKRDSTKFKFFYCTPTKISEDGSKKPENLYFMNSEGQPLITRVYVPTSTDIFYKITNTQEIYNLQKKLKNCWILSSDGECEI